MSINDPLRIEPYKGRFIVCRGPETFYNPETREIVVHETVAIARAWAIENHGADPQAASTTEPESFVNLPLFQAAEGE